MTAKYTINNDVSTLLSGLGSGDRRCLSPAALDLQSNTAGPQTPDVRLSYTSNSAVSLLYMSLQCIGASVVGCSALQEVEKGKPRHMCQTPCTLITDHSVKGEGPRFQHYPKRADIEFQSTGRLQPKELSCQVILAQTDAIYMDVDASAVMPTSR